MSLFAIVLSILRAFLMSKTDAAAEILCLRQQVATLSLKNPRPRLTKRDRIFWVWMSSLWSRWKAALVVVKPETVARWHKSGFKLYWTRKCKKGRGPGRPKTDPMIRRLIRQISRDNPFWGTPMIQKTLALLGYKVSSSTIWKYLDRSHKYPSMRWRTFFINYASEIAAIDFFSVATATFRNLYCFVVLEHSTRKIIHFNVTADPSAQWAAFQVVQAFPWDTAPRFILRDNDKTYGDFFSDKMEAMNIEEVRISRYSPWQNPFCERVIGSIRRDCLDHLIVLNEAHLWRILSEYVAYYNATRPHGSLDGNCPIPREIQGPDQGKIVAIPVLGGLHHRYDRVAA